MHSDFFDAVFNELNDFFGPVESSSCRDYKNELACECNENTYKNTGCGCEKTDNTLGHHWCWDADNKIYRLNQEVSCGKDDCSIEVVDNKHVKITYRVEEVYENAGFCHRCNRNGVITLALPDDADVSSLKATYDKTDSEIRFTVNKKTETPAGTFKIELN